MAKRLAVTAVMVVATVFIPGLAKADSVWTYQGNALSAPGAESGDGALTGTVLLNGNNQVEAWSFSAPNGPVPLVFSNTNTIDVSFNLFNCSSCSGTPFKGWSISMIAPTPPPIGADLFSSWNPDTGVGLDFVTNHNGGFGQVHVTDNPGVWTEVVSTPEPSSLISLLAGFGTLTAFGFLIKLRA